MTEPLLTARELADVLNLSASTVLDWFEAGRLPGFKLGRAVRFRESEILAWLEARRVGPLVHALTAVRSSPEQRREVAHA
ncbi:MAG TPA: helix-turn-helix domain-containing protein [Gaiellaceae bacterium]|nr:helix-turn-helix domain-containing protein [Gaiellaceae bacterium]